MPDTPRDPGYFWIQGTDEPEPARWDGEGWALIGGGEVTDPVVLREVAIEYDYGPED